MKSAPQSRRGWYDWYVKRYNKVVVEGAAAMACFYLLLMLQDEDSECPVAEQ